MKKIEVGYGLQAIVSDEDYDHVSEYKWWLDPHDATCYARGQIDGLNVYMHRFIAHNVVSPKVVVDHLDGWGLNNQRANLRVCTQASNVRNLHPCRFNGVRRHKRARRWEYFDWQFEQWLGDYATAFDAALAHDYTAIRCNLTDELNFPRHFAATYSRSYPSLNEA